jgi:hypothetical protein
MDITDDEAASLIRPVIGHPHQPIILETAMEPAILRERHENGVACANCSTLPAGEVRHSPNSSISRLSRLSRAIQSRFQHHSTPDKALRRIPAAEGAACQGSDG